MVKNNNLITQIENKKPFEIVSELKDYEVKKSSLSVAARGKVINKSNSNYLSENKDDYGPCKNSLCGCSCYSDKCVCVSSSLLNEGEWGTNLTASGRAWSEELEPMNLRTLGIKDVGAGSQVSSSLLSCKDFSGEIKVLSGTAGGEINSSSIKGKLSADLLNFKTDGIQMRAGVSVDTGVSIEDGFELKVAGFGFNVGKQTGISTPVGEIKVDTDKCVIQ